MTITERQVLKPGTSLSLDGRKCMILGVMGAGTSCIAYKAQMKLTVEGKTASRTIVLKELYPAHQNIIRETDNSLIIPDSSKAMFEEESESFVKAAILQFEFHNEENLTNFTSDIEVVYELNNTLYSVTGIVSGRSYDKTEPENITSILKVGELLSHAISYYHERDYLNLDIKPSNIFYENLPRDNVAIKLFDFNTVCTKEEALQGKFSYSDGYAAPEVKAAKKGSGKFSDLGEQADIYSIGAVIFEKIMGRIPKVADQRAGKRWKLESNPYLKDAVPQLQNGITDLFRKTLAIDKKDRYSFAKELISVLEKLIKLAGIKVFLKNQRISPCTPRDIYIPRKAILSKISKSLDEKHILYLHAIGGSGKSETAREYAEQYADKYDFIQSVFYSDSLKKTIANLDFVGLNDKDRFAHTDEDIDRLYNYKYGLLGNASVYGTNTLLIIDNYNPTSEEVIHNQEIISRLKELHINILFTTRVKPTDISECFDLENMVPEELRALFFRINPKDKDKPERVALVDEIIKLSYNHTMTVKLVAMQSAEYMKPLEEYRNVLQEKGLNSGFESEIINEKDGRLVIEDSVYNHIRALFKLNELNPKQKYIMVNACLLPLSGLEATTFSQYIDLVHFESSSGSDFLDPDIKRLVNSGWIEYADTSEKRFTAETKITLHPLICDIVKNELKPELTEDKCRKFYVSFLDLIQEWGNISKENLTSNYNINKIYDLFPKMNVLFHNNRIVEALNYIFLPHPKISIHNYTIYDLIPYLSLEEDCPLVEDELILYFGIDKEYIISPKINISGPKNIIGSKAFANCTFLTKITIPNSVTIISEKAFENCTSLMYINIPNSIKIIEKGTFTNCTSLNKINIPDSVTKIGNNAFKGCKSLTKLIIPNSIDEIGYSAFENCTSLTEINIPNSVTVIGDSAFAGCTSLKKINIPKSVTEIGYSAFNGCTSLTEINIPNSVTEIGDSAFAGCTSLKKINIPKSIAKINVGVFFGCTSLKEINIPSSVTVIEFDAFVGCTALKKIDMPESITTLGSGAFKLCKSLKKINISNNVTEIISNAFMGCTSLKEINIPDSVTKIGNSAFADCTSLAEISIPNSVTTIESDAFKGCISLTEINIPKSVKEIGDSAFAGCTSLEEVTIPDNVKKIGKEIFNDCHLLIKLNMSKQMQQRIFYIEEPKFKDNTTLKKVIIPDSVTEIGDSAFNGCTSLTEITIPNSVTTIGSGAFMGCTSLKEINIPDSVTKIGNSAFENCTSLEEITIPNNVTKIEWHIFHICNSLKKINISNNVTAIGSNAFMGCTSLTEISIPNSVTTIESGAFMGCHSLKEINIPDSVTEIEGYVFVLCTSLEKISIPNSVTIIGHDAFNECNALKEITIPSSVKIIGHNAFELCTSLKEINVPDSVTLIDYRAFASCTSLKKITIPNSVITIGISAFKDCTSLEEITIPSSVTVIDYSAFAGCTSLKEINIPKSVTEIKDSAFKDCTSLEEITIPSSVAVIGDSAFVGCTSLKKITILNPQIYIYQSKVGYYIDNNNLYRKNEDMIIESFKISRSEQYAQEHGFKFVPLD